MFLVEADVFELGVDLGLGFVVEEALDGAALDDVLCDDFLGVLGLDADVEGFVGEDLDDGAFFAEAEAAGADDLGFGGDALGFEFALEGFVEFGAAVGGAGGAAADEEIGLDGHGMGPFGVGQERRMSVEGLSMM